MSKDRKEKIKESAEEIVDSFAEIAEGLPTEKETYYEQNILNILRSAGEPKSDEEMKKFREKFVQNMPSSDKDGNLKVEVAEWTE